MNLDECLFLKKPIKFNSNVKIEHEFQLCVKIFITEGQQLPIVLLRYS